MNFFSLLIFMIVLISIGSRVIREIAKSLPDIEKNVPPEREKEIFKASTDEVRRFLEGKRGGPAVSRTPVTEGATLTAPPTPPAPPPVKTSAGAPERKLTMKHPSGRKDTQSAVAIGGNDLTRQGRKTSPISREKQQHRKAGRGIRNASGLRKMILHHEILSRPLALRNSGQTLLERR